MEGGDEHKGLRPLELKGVSQSMDLSKKAKKGGYTTRSQQKIQEAAKEIGHERLKV